MDTLQNLGVDCQAPSQKRVGKRRLPGALGLVGEDLHHPDVGKSETSQAVTVTVTRRIQMRAALSL